ncbi:MULTISPECIES: sensor histidine kinase [unclassified Nocardiopsis]|uniref:sensor histidine kinase n=1 Tax=Nocardiopsis TaxID=2013 RepID=UPI00387AED5C
MSDQAQSPARGRAPRGARWGTVLLVGVFVFLAVANGVFCLAVIEDAEPLWVLAGVAVMAGASVVLVPLGPRFPGAVAVAVVLLAVSPYLSDTGWRELALAGGLIWPVLALAWAAANLVGRARGPGSAVAGAAAFVGYAVFIAIVSGTEGFAFVEALNASSPVLGGASLALYGRLSQARRDRARQEERERALLAERARIDERRRLAREMHDVVSHQVSLIVLQAGALASTSADPGVREIADRIRAAGGKAVDELREMVGVLNDPASVRPDPPVSFGSVAEAPDLLAPVREAEEAGQRVDLAVRGDLAGLPPHVARALHRVVQECLTNARKHAPGAAVGLRVVRERDAVLVEAENPVDDGLAGPLIEGTGTGLEGLRHRVEMLDGSLRAGRDGDGFRVAVVVPLPNGESEEQR